MDEPIAIIGNVNADIVARPVSGLPPPGGDLLVETIEIRVGGAAALAALGLRPRLAGCVGDDLLGTSVHSILRDRGLADEVTVLPGVATGVSICLEGPERDRSFISMRGALDLFDRSMVPDDLLASPFQLVCGYFTMRALRGDRMRALLQEARSNRATILLDPDVDPGGWSASARGEIAGLLPLVDGFLPNEHEARGLTGKADPLDAARSLHEDTGGWIVVKLGADGAVAIDPGGSLHRVSAPAVEVHDTTGAGDSFDAGVLAGLLNGWSTKRALELGCACGALSTRAAGGTAAQPTLDEALALVEAAA
jgi:argininosuccinate lyase